MRRTLALSSFRRAAIGVSRLVSRTSPSAQTALRRTCQSVSRSVVCRLTSAGRTTALSSASPMAIAAYRRTVALTSVNASTSGFIAARPMRASARDASRAGDVAQSKISLLSPQRFQPSPSSPHGSDETSVSSPSRTTSEGIAETASVPRRPSSRAADARSSALTDFRPSARDSTTRGVGCAAAIAVPAAACGCGSRIGGSAAARLRVNNQVPVRRATGGTKGVFLRCAKKLARPGTPVYRKVLKP